jgi:hypothetical protein
MAIWAKIKRFFIEYMLLFSSLLVGASTFLLLWGLVVELEPEFMGSLVEKASILGDYHRFFIIIPPFGIILGGWYLGSTIYKRRRFEKMVSTEKKSDFVKSLHELELLSHKLPDSYRKRFKKTKKRFGL